VGERWKLIEGMPYAMSTLPVPEHQRTRLRLSIRFEDALTDCNECTVYPSLDWKISDDTIVQPDIYQSQKVKYYLIGDAKSIYFRTNFYGSLRL